MYCSSCGGAVAKGLSYCNHCGVRLINTDLERKHGQVKPDLLVTSMVATFIFGLIAITALMGVMRVILGLPVSQVLVFSLVPFVLMLVLESVFIRLLFRRPTPVEGAKHEQALKEQTTNELDATAARRLAEGLPSVTEHTTRAFDPVYNDRK